MKYNIKKKVTLNLTLDSSEMIMFTKGGRHNVEIDPLDLFTHENDLHNFEFEITVQMERSELGRFEFITGEAEKHKERQSNENK